MSTPDVLKQLSLSGQDPSAITCTLTIVAAVDQAAFGYVSSTSLDVGVPVVVSPDNTGLITFTDVSPTHEADGVTPNPDFSPEGSVYKVTTVMADRTRIEEFIAVPDVAGPVYVADILTTEPDSLPPGGGTLIPLAGDVEGPAGGNTINALAVTTGKLADDAVTTAKIAPDAVTSAEIAPLAVGTTELAAGAVTTTELGALAVTTAKIAASAVTATELASNAATTAKINDAAVTTSKLAAASATPAKLAGEVAGIFDPLISFSGWTDANTTSSTAFDALSLVKIGTRYWVTCANPDQGPNNVSNRAAAHGARYKDFGSEYADNVRVRCYWSAKRPVEGGPIIHVVEGTTEWGIGMWEGYDAFPALPGIQSVFLLGMIGNNNTNFPGAVYSAVALNADQLAKYSDLDNPSAPVPVDLVSVGNTVTVYVDGELITGLSITVPVALRGSSTHGICIDNNQTDHNDGAGGAAFGGTDRPANTPAACGPFSITKVLTSGRPLAEDGAAAPDAREKGATTYGPVRNVARADTYRPGGETPVPSWYTQIATTAGVEVAHAHFINDGTGKGSFVVAQANGHQVNFGSFLGVPAIGFYNGTDTTFLLERSGGAIGFTDDIDAPSVAPSGINGATAGQRFVGRIATGLPTSGVVGDEVTVTDTRLKYLCTATGTPGTWVAIGSATFQPLDADLTTLAGLASIANLTALAGLSGAADKVGYFTGSGAMSLTDFKSYGRSLAGLVDRAAFVTLVAPTMTDISGTGTMQHPATGGSQTFTSFGTIPLHGYRRDGDTADRTQVSSEGIGIGSGAAATDVSMSRSGANAMTLTASSGVTITGNLTLSAKNIVTDTTTGMQVGTGNTQKLGFFGATPIVRPSSTTDLRAALINLGLYTTGGASPLDLNGGALANGTQTFTDATNMVFGSTTGTKLGTATTQKFAFWNKTPIVQPTTGITAATFVANAGTAVNDASTFGGYTLGKVVAALVNVGILA